MNLVHSSPRKGSEASSEQELVDGERQADTGSELSELAQDAVPVRDHAVAHIEREREERIKAVVGNAPRRLLRISRNAFLGCVGVVLLATIAILSALSSGASEQAATVRRASPTAPRPVAAPTVTNKHQSSPRRHFARAERGRRAAIRARKRAARRRAKARRVEERTTRHRPSEEVTPSPAKATPEVSAPATPAPEPAATSAPAPEPSISPDEAQGEFGFEH